MEDINPSSVSYSKLSLRYGLIGSGLIILVGLLFYVAGLSLKPGMNWVSSLLNLAIYIWVARTIILYHRDQQLGGFISFGRGFAASMLAVLVMAVVGAIYFYLFMTVIAPDFTESILDMQIEKLEDQGVSEEQMEMQIGFMKKMMTPGALSFMGLGMTLIFGGLVSLVTAAVLKKEAPTG